MFQRSLHRAVPVAPLQMARLVVAVLLVILPSYRARRARLRARGVSDGD